MAAATVAGTVGASVIFLAMFMALAGSGQSSACGTGAGSGSGFRSGAGAVLLPPSGGAVVGATEYGGPGDPSSGTVGSSGTDLLAAPDSFAELGGTSFVTATALGGLAYGTPLRISWGDHSLIARKEDIGLGGGPIDGRPRAIDLWWELAGHLGIPYERGLWSGLVHIARPPASGTGALLGALPTTAGSTGAPAAGAAGAAPAALGCAAEPWLDPGALTASVPGPRARLLPDGLAAAPATAPAAVQAMIAAGNQIVGKPYLYGGAHGAPLSEVEPAYDCSSSVSHLLWGAGQLSAEADMTSGELMSWGRPGLGRWVTIYASPEHVFMYVAGLRWDTWNAAGPGDGTAGIGWHPLIRAADGFVARHPPGL